MFKRILFPLGILLGALFAASYFGYGLPLFAPIVSVSHPVRGPAIVGVYAPGHVESERMTPIAPKITGRLMEFFKDEGDKISPGDSLFTLDDSETQTLVQDATAKESLAKTTYTRLASLRQKGVVTQAALDEAQATWQSAQAALAGAQAQHNMTLITAPHGGVVIRRDGERGQMIPATQTVFWLSCCGSFLVLADVDEEDISGITPGLPVLLRADAFPGRLFEGRVLSVTPKGDPIARTFRLKISLPENTPLLIGMTVEANIILSRRENALLIPKAALVQSDPLQGPFVWTVRGGKLERHSVETGAFGETHLEILKGLREGDSVVITPNPTFQGGQSVRSQPLAHVLMRSKGKERTP